MEQRGHPQRGRVDEASTAKQGRAQAEGPSNHEWATETCSEEAAASTGRAEITGEVGPAARSRSATCKAEERVPAA